MEHTLSEPTRVSARTGRSWPWLTVAVVACAGLAGALPGASVSLEYNRSLVLGGEVWRLVTGQAVHWSPRMAFADLGMVLLLGALLEVRSRRLLAVTLATGAIACGLVIHWLHPGLVSYRGASGVATALMAALAVSIVRTEERRAVRAAAFLCLALLLIKMIGEVMLGRAFFAGPLPPGIEVTPLVHLAGAIAGAVAAFTARLPSASSER